MAHQQAQHGQRFASHNSLSAAHRAFSLVIQRGKSARLQAVVVISQFTNFTIHQEYSRSHDMVDIRVVCTQPNSHNCWQAEQHISFCVTAQLVAHLQCGQTYALKLFIMGNWGAMLTKQHVSGFGPSYSVCWRCARRLLVWSMDEMRHWEDNLGRKFLSPLCIMQVFCWGSERRRCGTECSDTAGCIWRAARGSCRCPLSQCWCGPCSMPGSWQCWRWHQNGTGEAYSTLGGSSSFSSRAWICWEYQNCHGKWQVVLKLEVPEGFALSWCCDLGSLLVTGPLGDAMLTKGGQHAMIRCCIFTLI